MFGFFTRPSIGADSDGDPMVHGSHSDALGQCVPVKIPLELFNNCFTTPVHRRDAIALGLATHPSHPESVDRPPPAGTRNANPIPVSPERLQFNLSEDATDDDNPVIVAMPVFLPLPFGVTSPHLTNLDLNQSFRNDSLMLNVWINGLLCAINPNGGNSVTEGGDLFHLPASEVNEGVNDPIASHPVRIRIPRSPTVLSLTKADCVSAALRIQAWSEENWHELGSNMVVEPLPPLPDPAPTPVNPEALAEAMTNREKTFKNANGNMAWFRVALGKHGLRFMSPLAVNPQRRQPTLWSPLSQSFWTMLLLSLKKTVEPLPARTSRRWFGPGW